MAAMPQPAIPGEGTRERSLCVASQPWGIGAIQFERKSCCGTEKSAVHQEADRRSKNCCGCRKNAFLCSIRDYDKASDTFLVANQRLKVNGDPIKIQADTHGGTYRSHPVVEKDPSFYIAIVRDTVSGKLRVNVRLAGPTWAVQSGTYTDFRFWTEKPDDSRLVNKTYTNTAWLTPLRDDLGWDGTATKGVIDKKLSAPYWDKTRTSIRSSANVMVSYGYSTSSSIAVSQTDPADHTVYSTSSDEADTTTILPDKNDKVHYTLTVDNTVYASPQALTKLVLINNLPQEGDHNPFQDDDMRGSEYQMSLTEGNTFTVKASIRQNDGTFETKVIDPKYIKIQYSKDVSFDGDDWNGKESVKWTTNPEGARSFRIIIDDPSGAAMPAHSKVTVEYDAKADTPDSIEPGQTAYNSFGYHYEVKAELHWKLPPRALACVPRMCPPCKSAWRPRMVRLWLPVQMQNSILSSMTVPQ